MTRRARRQISYAGLDLGEVKPFPLSRVPNTVPTSNPDRKLPHLARALLVLFALAMAAIICAADRNALPGLIKWMYAFPGGDKIGHFVLFGVFALLAELSANWRRVSLPGLGLAFPLGAGLIAVLAALEELSQSFFSSRTFSAADFAATFAGIVAFTFLARTLRPRNGTHGSPSPLRPD